MAQSNNTKISPRQELGNFVGRGELRGIIDKKPGALSEQALDLLVTIALRYCETRRPRRKK